MARSCKAHCSLCQVPVLCASARCQYYVAVTRASSLSVFHYSLGSDLLEVLCVHVEDLLTDQQEAITVRQEVLQPRVDRPRLLGLTSHGAECHRVSCRRAHSRRARCHKAHSYRAHFHRHHSPWAHFRARRAHLRPTLAHFRAKGAHLRGRRAQPGRVRAHFEGSSALGVSKSPRPGVVGAGTVEGGRAGLAAPRGPHSEGCRSACCRAHFVQGGAGSGAGARTQPEGSGRG